MGTWGVKPVQPKSQSCRDTKKYKSSREKYIFFIQSSERLFDMDMPHRPRPQRFDYYTSLKPIEGYGNS